MPKENSTHQVDPMDKWVSIEQAANYLGVSVVTVRSCLLYTSPSPRDA